MWNTDKEYMAGLRYILTKNFGITTHYDSDMGLGLDECELLNVSSNLFYNLMMEIMKLLTD
jgi:hypothetical protein